jgi:hypothetical protein
VEGQTDSSLRRLIPFSGPGVLPALSMPAQSGRALSNPASAVADAVGPQAASIVSQAVSILNDEITKGLLGVRTAGVTAPPGLADASNPVLRQMHEVVDNLAKLWPSLQTGVTPQLMPASQAAAYDADPLAEVRPRATVKPGQRATISMTLRNSENRPVNLVPTATDLLGSQSGRIACSLLECTPSEITLQPKEERDLTIATTVPVDAGPGCYSGLLVVRGLDYLRALITIEVV